MYTSEAKIENATERLPEPLRAEVEKDPGAAKVLSVAGFDLDERAMYA